MHGQQIHWHRPTISDSAHSATPHVYAGLCLATPPPQPRMYMRGSSSPRSRAPTTPHVHAGLLFTTIPRPHNPACRCGAPPGDAAPQPRMYMRGSSSPRSRAPTTPHVHAGLLFTTIPRPHNPACTCGAPLTTTPRPHNPACTCGAPRRHDLPRQRHTTRYNPSWPSKSQARACTRANRVGSAQTRQ
jgi:hypothetical protein